MNDRLAPAQMAIAAVLVAAAYFVGIQIGLALTFPPATTSLLWPPNAILTAALLLLPVRQWWICLAALPVHVIPELAAGMSPPLVGLLFLTNCSEALIAASLVRWLSDAPTEFNTLRRVTVFLVAAIAAPVLSSFADATLVSVFRGEPYWTVWRIRTFANALTELSVVPCLVLATAAILRGVAWPRVQGRLLEASVLVIGLTGAAVWVLGGWSSTPGLPRTPSVLLLPFFFWAATRFGVGGVSGSLLVAALVTSYETRAGHRPFEMLPPVESLMAVQMYLSLMGVPLMCVAGLLEERRRGSSDLRERLRFEGLLSAISGAFVHLPSAAPASAFDDPLRRVGEFLKVDYVALLQTGEHGRGLEVTRQWCEESAAGLCGPQCVTAFPWAFARVAAGDTIVCETVESLPANATADRSAFKSFGLESAVVLPLVGGGQVQGALSVVTLTRRVWTGEVLVQLQLVAEVLANACARRRAEIELQRSRQELAHMARLSSMGELTASLAHQLNQPLAGILSNAQAARRFIDSGRATLPELRDIVVDIIADDQRAGEVIRRVREMLTRTERPAVALDANAIVRDVVALIASDAVLRNVSVSYDLTTEPLIITGHRIDVEHVLLNVITNGMDAVASQPVPDRVVNVRTTRNGQDRALIIVHDSGEGLPAGMEHRIFEPFVSTKPSGMGMGLAVARSLVDDHGGSIRADNHPLGGAIVTISFPDASVTTRDPTRSSSRTAAVASQSLPS